MILRKEPVTILVRAVRGERGKAHELAPGDMVYDNAGPRDTFGIVVAVPAPCKWGNDMAYVLWTKDLQLARTFL